MSDKMLMLVSARSSRRSDGGWQDACNASASTVWAPSTRRSGKRNRTAAAMACVVQFASINARRRWRASLRSSVRLMDDGLVHPGLGATQGESRRRESSFPICVVGANKPGKRLRRIGTRIRADPDPAIRSPSGSPSGRGPRDRFDRRRAWVYRRGRQYRSRRRAPVRGARL